MSDNQRIDDLRRRVQKDPASIAFAQLAEELRRAGQFQESVDTCRAGLAIHPSYLSARVTLGRALVELGALDAAEAEFDNVLRSAGDNLAALRGLGDISQRRGDISAALARYRRALAIAPNDFDLEERVTELAARADRETPAASGDTRAVPAFEAPQPAAATDDEPPPAAEAADAVSFGPEPPDPERDRALRTLAALDGWLTAIHVARADRRA